jgi:hypothetical protein
MRTRSAVTSALPPEINFPNWERSFSYTSSAVWQSEESISISIQGTTEVEMACIEIIPASETVISSQLFSPCSLPWLFPR